MHINGMILEMNEEHRRNQEAYAAVETLASTNCQKMQRKDTLLFSLYQGVYVVGVVVW